MAIWEEKTGEIKGINPQEKNKKKQKPELALCIPHQSTVNIAWALAFKHLQFPSRYAYFLNRNKPYDVAREEMTRDALKADPEYLFYLDSDTYCQDPQAVMKLINISKEKNMPIVSGLYWAKKQNMNVPSAWIIDENRTKGRDIKYNAIDIAPHVEKNNIVEAHVVGMGFCLIHKSVFEKLIEKNPEKPFFRWGWGRQDDELEYLDIYNTSEDFNFFMRTHNELNLHPYVVTGIQCHHICTGQKNGKDGHLELMPL